MRQSWMSLLSLLLMACSSGRANSAPVEMHRLDASVAEDLNRVRQARILFSHHSVGWNLLTGVQGIDTEVGGGKLNVIELADDQVGQVGRRDKLVAGPALFHVSGGDNGAPNTKIDFFVALLNGLRDPKPQLAFMKLCFVDFNSSTNVDELFAYYQNAIATLKREHPEITFAHVTAPLTTRPNDLKSRIKRLIGRQVPQDLANAKRGQFNDRLLKAFANTPIFDLARAESTRPDGSRELFGLDGQEHASMVPAYTDDGGHLNGLGQRIIGQQMLHFLAGALARPDVSR